MWQFRLYPSPILNSSTGKLLSSNQTYVDYEQESNKTASQNEEQQLIGIDQLELKRTV
jgi:hypothetical protein